MFLPAKKLLLDARKRGYALGAFNTGNLEITQAIINAAVAKKSPLIINVSESAIEYASLGAITSIIKSLGAEEAAKKIPMAIQVDHGKKIERFPDYIKAGFTALMMDASRFSYEENVSLTAKTVKLAHKYKISAQGELGAVPYKGEEEKFNAWEKAMTDLEQAKEFVRKTGVDYLAVAIGNAHGFYKERAELDFDRLEKISKLVKIPLVLHGASDFPDTRIKDAIARGVALFHIDTEIRVAFSSAIKEYLGKNPAEYDPRKILAFARERTQKAVEKKMEVFGSAGMA
ncbi:class II fructose-bisphosphate aldolase [Patescibacteria group bacterium]|nr:class II fructose-bisphosphate aldolase [Patescibacteria group bacterium]MBU4580017.1 class II fructose-bisphosphate aldolase [Patescibacteria group bacterium]